MLILKTVIGLKTEEVIVICFILLVFVVVLENLVLCFSGCFKATLGYFFVKKEVSFFS